ncbi:MAG: hypothetical protein ACYTG5_06890 [Planctomycetota bacterium]|jgi:hypothetical protein
MRNRGFLINSAVALLGVVLGCASSTVESVGAPQEPSAEGLRIGVFNTRAVALAYGRSSRPDCMIAQADKIRAAHKAAEEAGDEDKAKELAAQAVARQEKIHTQVFSDAPIPEILQLIEDEMADVAKAAGVDLIVGQVLHKAKGVELIDITWHMCTPFEPDEKTRKGIEELLKTKPVPLSELKHDH